jgi:hypothetical protein
VGSQSSLVPIAAVCFGGASTPTSDNALIELRTNIFRRSKHCGSYPPGGQRFLEVNPLRPFAPSSPRRLIREAASRQPFSGSTP